MQDSEPWREKVARIIDPEAWQGLDLEPQYAVAWQHRCEPSLAKADAIAALSPAPEGWREALEGLSNAVKGLTARTLDGVIFFEANPTDSPDTMRAWQALDAAQKAANQALSASPLPVGGGEERDSGSDVAAARAPVSEGSPTPLEGAFEDVRDFHVAFNVPAPDRPTMLEDSFVQRRAAWIEEEAQELREATTMAAQADAFIDAIYFAVGGLVEMGIRPDPIWNIVQTANMSKLWEDGKPRFRESDGKIVKPPTWIDPDPLIVAEVDRQAKTDEAP